ncbi:MAG: hypothetical protein ACT4OP_09575 [Actinomycetota bacterium]
MSGYHLVDYPTITRIPSQVSPFGRHGGVAESEGIADGGNGPSRGMVDEGGAA